jgi:hypothetical protein
MEQSGFVHLGYPPPASGWVLRLLTRIQQSASSALRERVSQSGTSKLSELGLAVSSKIHIVGVSKRRVDSVVDQIAKEIQGRKEEVVALLNSDAAIQVRQEGVLFEALLDIEAFLFEMHSTLEITETFVKLFRRSILGDVHGRREKLHECFTRLNIDQSWYESLDRARNLFSHETAPWLALDIQSTDPYRFDLVVLKKNVIVPRPEDYFHFDECRGMYRGYFGAMERLHEWLLAEIDACA